MVYDVAEPTRGILGVMMHTRTAHYAFADCFVKQAGILSGARKAVGYPITGLGEALAFLPERGLEASRRRIQIARILRGEKPQGEGVKQFIDRWTMGHPDLLNRPGGGGAGLAEEGLRSGGPLGMYMQAYPDKVIQHILAAPGQGIRALGREISGAGSAARQAAREEAARLEMAARRKKLLTRGAIAAGGIGAGTGLGLALAGE